MKNKKCVHTWANSTGYTSLEIIEMDFATLKKKSYVFEETGFWDFYHGTNEGAGSPKANSNT